MPPEDEINISCPHCMQQSEIDVYLFSDIDKSKPLKVYTDSPTGTVVLGFGAFAGIAGTNPGMSLGL